jgi:hypothetical protein
VPFYGFALKTIILEDNIQTDSYNVCLVDDYFALH